MIPILRSAEELSDSSTCVGDAETASVSGSDAATACSTSSESTPVPLLVVQNTFWQAPGLAVGASRRCKSLPKDLGTSSRCAVLEEDSDDDLSATPALTESPCWTPRCMHPASFGSIPPGNFVSDCWQFDDSAYFGCPIQEPTWSKVAEEDCVPPVPQHEPSCWVGFSSCKAACIVRKTFVELDEPSPPATGCRRSRSLPRSLGLPNRDEDGMLVCSDAIDLTRSSTVSLSSGSFEAPSEQSTALAEEIAASFEGRKGMSICLSNLL